MSEIFKPDNPILKRALSLKGYYTNIRRKIHQYPELGMKEFKTTDLIKKELTNIGVIIKTLKSEVGVLGILQGLKRGKNRVTAIRADIDALPVLEKTNMDYSSRNTGIMHACGHDGHIAILLGTAKLLSELKEEFSGSVKLIFQPDEEHLNGAKILINEGVLENPKVDTIIALHCWPFIKTGKIGIWEGSYMASSDQFFIKILGKGGHGAYPHRSVDTILAAAELVVSLQRIVSREIDSLHNVVISVCTVHGGNAPNVIPEEVEIAGTVRCQQSDLREIVRGKMKRVIEGIAHANGCDFVFDYKQGVSVLKNHPEVIQLMRESAGKVLGKENIEVLEKPAMGSEDFSNYLEKVPFGALIRLGNTDIGQSPKLLHNSAFDFNDNAIPVGIALFSQFILDRNQ